MFPLAQEHQVMFPLAQQLCTYQSHDPFDAGSKYLDSAETGPLCFDPLDSGSFLGGHDVEPLLRPLAVESASEPKKIGQAPPCRGTTDCLTKTTISSFSKGDS